MPAAGETGRIVHVVDSDLGYGYNLAVHSWKIAQGLSDPRQLAVFCRAATREARSAYDVRTIGLGRTAGRLLKGVNRYVTRRVRHREIEAAVFERSLRRGLAALAAQPLSVVHTWTAIPRLLAPLKERDPSLLLLHDYTMGTGNSDEDRREIRANLAVYDSFFSPSVFVTEMLVDSGVPPGRIHCVPYGVDTDEFKPRASGETHGEFRVAFSGLVCRRKGIPALLEAWERLDLPGAELNLYGRVDPPLAPLVRDAARHRVSVRGFVDLRSELPRNDLFVFPSLWEGSAKAVYEALACGLPVITTRHAGSVVEDGVQGFIVPTGDAAALAERIRYFFDNRGELARFGEAARAQAQNYTWSRYAKSVIDCYRRGA